MWPPWPPASGPQLGALKYILKYIKYDGWDTCNLVRKHILRANNTVRQYPRQQCCDINMITLRCNSV